MAILVPWQLATDPLAPFPPASSALREPDGLLAIGGDLHPHRLQRAYRAGVFPWFNPGEPILWWSPDPRTVFDTASFRLSRSNRRDLRRTASHWQISINRAFTAVIHGCATAHRRDQHGSGSTWLSTGMQQAYTALHGQGLAHSIEVWDREELVGGLYGVGIGRMFFAESMFSRQSGASKIALAGICRHLADHACPLLDAQVHNPHLKLLGAQPMQRDFFIQKINTLTNIQTINGQWKPSARITVLDLLA